MHNRNDPWGGQNIEWIRRLEKTAIISTAGKEAGRQLQWSHLTQPWHSPRRPAAVSLGDIQ